MLTFFLFRDSAKMEKNILAFTVLACLVLVCPGQPQQCFKKGECTHSYQILGKVINNEYLCRKECQLNPSCRWFTYFEKSNYCQLYENCAKLNEQSCSNCLSGEKECLTREIKCKLAVKCTKTPFSSSSTQNIEDCLRLCKEEARCKLFTYNNHLKSCEFFASCGELSKCSDCISGHYKCNVEPRGKKY